MGVSAQGVVGIVVIFSATVTSNIVPFLHSVRSLSFLCGLPSSFGNLGGRTGSAKKTAVGIWRGTAVTRQTQFPGVRNEGLCLKQRLWAEWNLKQSPCD